MSHLLPGGPTRRDLGGTDGTSATDQIPLSSCKDGNQSDRRKAMSNAHEIRARSRRSAVAPRYIRPSHVCKSPSAASSADPSATTSAQSLLQAMSAASSKALQAHSSSPALASNEAANEAFMQGMLRSCLTAIRMTINNSQQQHKRALNQQNQFHTFDTGTVLRCISLRAGVELESIPIHSHK